VSTLKVSQVGTACKWNAARRWRALARSEPVTPTCSLAMMANDAQTPCMWPMIHSLHLRLANCVVRDSLGQSLHHVGCLVAHESRDCVAFLFITRILLMLCALHHAVPVPKAGASGQVLIKMNGSSVNPSDVDTVEYGGCMTGCGADLSGTVVACQGCNRLKVGDEVWGLSSPAYAE
jgi:hypothetical protein